MDKQSSERIAPTQEDSKIDAALKQVYAQYGSDLGAFFVDANREAERYALEAQRCAKRDVETEP
jgi:hypothetical protein